MFATKQVIWAKTKGYPWWPAEISKLPTPDHNYFKVSFLGQNNHAVLQPKAIRKYFEYYEELKTKKFKGLQNSIDLANAEMQKRKIFQNEVEKDSKPNAVKPLEKIKKIKKKNKKKSKVKRPVQKKQKQQNIPQSAAIQLQKLQPLQIQQPKQQLSKEKQFKSQNESICISEGFEEEDFQINELEYLRNVDRPKIQSTEEILVSYITRFNASNYEKEKECYELLLKIQKDDFKPQQLLQSKITNMISYIQKKLVERTNSALKKEQIQMIKAINAKLKQSVVSYLFDCCYYDQYLKRMERSITLIKQQEKRHKVEPAPLINAKSKKYKRKYLHKRKGNEK